MKPLFVIGALAVAGGVAVVLVRKAQAAGAAPGGYVPGIRCKAARAVAAIYGRTITDAQCEAADKVDDKIGVGAIVDWLKPAIPSWVVWAEKDAKNKSLNGAVAVPLTDEVRALTRQYSKDGTMLGALLGGSVLRFQNGGVPFAMHPDFSKCVPGTHDMTGTGGAAERFWAVPGVKPTSSQQLYDGLGGAGTGDKRIPLSDAAAWAKIGVRWSLTPAIGQLLTGSGYDPATSVELGIVAGVKHECPPGQVLIEVIPVADHRGDGETAERTILKRCGAPGSAPTATAPPLAGSGSSTSYTAPPGEPPPGFHWVQAVGDVPAHWERI